MVDSQCELLDLQFTKWSSLRDSSLSQWETLYQICTNVSTRVSQVRIPEHIFPSMTILNPVSGSKGQNERGDYRTLCALHNQVRTCWQQVLDRKRVRPCGGLLLEVFYYGSTLVGTSSVTHTCTQSILMDWMVSNHWFGDRWLESGD